MCFRKKEEFIPTDAPIAEQARPFLEHRRRLSDLDFENANNVEIAIYCLNANPTMARDLDVNDPRGLAILKIWVRKDYSNYLLCINNNVNHIELLTLYIIGKLYKTLGTGNEGISLLASYDKKLLINYQYETKSGETISYFDKNLGVPTALVAKANLRLKLVNAQVLVNRIDIALRYLDMALVTNFITGIINKNMRDTILSFINSNELSFYDLPQYYTDINQAVFAKLSAQFAECGLALTEFTLSDISVPNNTDKLLRDSFFAISEAERMKEHEYKMEKEALDLYERKASIHSKYPDFPITLTEAEKDFALNRYLTRIGKDTSLSADINDKVLENRKVVNKGTVTTERKISAPKLIKKSNKVRLIYAISVAVMYFIAFLCFIPGVKVGFSLLACVTLISGVAGLVLFDKLKNGNKKEQIIDTGYRRENDMYIKQQQDIEVSENDTEKSDGHDNLN